ncbi:MAG TPA: GrpB family protein [Prosthecobacter sp.]
MKVSVVPPDLRWPEAFAREAAEIRAAAGCAVLDVHHIGSTAICGIYAKPVIDILLVVDRHTNLDARSAAMAALGYEVMGEFGIPGRRYFRKNSAEGLRTHQVHAFEAGSPHLFRHLAFRDYMNAHAEAAQAYSRLKQNLAAAFPHDIEAYMDGKDPFIQEHEAQALKWAKEDGMR